MIHGYYLIGNDMKHFSIVCLASIVCATVFAPVAHAEDNVFTLKIQDHRFTPEKIEIPADKKVKLVIINMDSTAEEFDSDDLHREKLIPPGKEGAVFIGPLKPGTYKFVGEYNQATAQGVVVVK
jgi:hypothetical protein